MTMKVYVADDEMMILEDELDVIREVMPHDEVQGFRRGLALLEAAKKEPCEVAFLDINMMDINGIELGAELKKLNPRINIIFVTAYDEYFRSAMEMHASGYLLKPLEADAVRKELADLRYQQPGKEAQPHSNALLRVNCFGNFDVRLPNGDPVRFERSRAKEAFAYLVYKHGSPVTIRELAAALFEDEPFDRKNQQYMQKILSSKMKTLRGCGAEPLMEKSFNSLSVRMELMEGDYFDWLKENKNARDKIPEGFMEQYSWAWYG